MSTPSHRFLLDENVRVELLRFLKAKGLDVRAARKSSHDPSLSSLSKKERRILVTNDEDFIEYTREEIFALLILRKGRWDNFALSRSFKFGKVWDFKS